MKDQVFSNTTIASCLEKNNKPEYAYYKNGAQTHAWNRGVMGTVYYNPLNLAKHIQMKDGHSVDYSYDALGVKRKAKYTTLKTTVTVYLGTTAITPPSPDDVTTLTTDYCGHIIYENGILKRILHPEGYLDKTTKYVYNYYLRDHLGNNRTVLTWSGSGYTSSLAVSQVMNYYPSGMPYTGAAYGDIQNSGLQPYKFGDKEYEPMYGLNQYYQGARFFGSDLPQTPTPDPMLEKYYDTSPYVQYGNNPVNRTDPTGMWIQYRDTTENKSYRYDNGEWYQYQTSGDNAGQWTAYTPAAGSFLAGLRNALNTINRTATGSQLLDFFANDDNNAYMQSVAGETFIDSNGEINMISLNKDFKGSLIPTEIGDDTSPFWLDTAHELAHRKDFILRGDAAKARWLEHDGVTFIESEKYATAVENQIRADALMKLRTHYAGLVGGGPWEDSRVLQVTRHPAGFGINYFTGGVYVPRIKIPLRPGVH